MHPFKAKKKILGRRDDKCKEIDKIYLKKKQKKKKNCGMRITMMKNSVNKCSIIILVLNWKETVIRGKSQKIYFLEIKV